ncbi:MAG: hypothetical protein CME34_18075 [Gordonia sp.]|jgi:hypothetical protein|uniref:DUF2637 domain-containing protein n=1 Tax=Gordonia sp. (in: high G+C Gram-positive bacteria) TaxID=84139 RepID=UPI000C622629|nr:DUF2637 domain-containing protein [Gordonia sp. (in: high G+C Gram-positive bacteria)]MAU83737.1 hypothetical protein [Gordonia sp. (in: high G+C Gram-positive bacteria)]
MSDPTHARNTTEAATNTASVVTSVILSLIVVAASFTLSFTALSDLARMSGAIPARLAWLLPVVIDVFILQATWCVYVATKRRDDAGKRYHFAMLAISSTVSVAGNAGHAFLASDQGVMHGLMAVAIAIVAPLALLASIHGLVMHVWAGGGVTVHDRTPDVEHAAEEGAPHAHSQVSVSAEPHMQPHGAQGDAGTSPVGLTDLDAQITDADLELARLVCSRGRLRNDDRAVARVLVAERLGVHREQTADLTGVHRTTIGRWRDLAAECTADMSSYGERAHTTDQPALVDAH